MLGTCVCMCESPKKAIKCCDTNNRRRRTFRQIEIKTVVEKIERGKESGKEDQDEGQGRDKWFGNFTCVGEAGAGSLALSTEPLRTVNGLVNALS
eukprot:1068267-Amorphochlora_amoeboformis.AAC.1